MFHLSPDDVIDGYRKPFEKPSSKSNLDFSKYLIYGRLDLTIKNCVRAYTYLYKSILTCLKYNQTTQ